MLAKRLIKSNDAGGGACTNTVDLYNPFPDGGGVALYQLNGDATDVSGNYDGTATNVTYGTGVFGQAGVFNGSSYIQAAAGYPSTLGNITVSGWFNFSNSNDGWVGNNSGSLFGLGQSTSVAAGNSLTIRLAENSTTFNLNSTNNDSSITMNSASPSRGTWFHIALTYETSSNKFKVYLNGEYQGESAALTYNFQTTAFRLGSGIQNGGVFHFQGLADQVRIFSRALRPYEVEALYTEEYCTPTIVPSEHFNTVTYTGDGQPTRNITGVGFQPDLVWVKGRTPNTLDHVLNDSVRGANKKLASNSNAAEVSPSIYGAVSSFTSDGFNLAKGLDNTYAGGLEVNGNLNAQTYVAWNFKAGGAAVTNTDGTITSQVSANTEAGFSVVSYTGNGANGTVGHGLGVTPNIVLTKRRNSTSNWSFNGNIGGLIYGTNKLALNDTIGISADTNEVLAANSNNFTAGTSGAVGASGGTYIAYCFAEVEGFSNFGSYVGTGAAGNTIVTGFEPAMIIIKRTDSIEDWKIIDNKRGFANSLEPNESIAEEAGNNANFTLSANGFTIGDPHGDYNASGGKYIYMAFAADPTAVEPTLEDSFNTVTYTGNGGANSITGVGFQPDFTWIKSRVSTNPHNLFDSIRGAGFSLMSNLTAAEIDETGYFTSFDADGFSFGLGGGNTNFNGYDYVAWNWKGAEIPAINSNGSIPSVVSANPAAGFSIVSYTGNGSTGTIGHGLSSAPSMLIIKNRSSSTNWVVGSNEIGWNYSLNLNDTSSAGLSTNRFNSTSPTSTVFSVGATSVSNGSGNSMIAYCFAEVAGFSKFGSYTGVSGEKVVDDLGFEPAFVMVRFTGAGGRWIMVDNKRGDGGFNVMKRLDANDSAAESTNSVYGLTFTSNGFTIPAGATSNLNAAGNTYIYMAFANQF